MPLASLKQQQNRYHNNPVYGSHFADPFVWKCGDMYYAVGTGALEASGQALGKMFPVLQSADFFQWKFASNALVKPDEDLGGQFWGPEVAYAQGMFHLYYSVGHDDQHHHLRVALSESPQGPYHDCGKALTDPKECPFATDPHPFRDEDGRWYLFYARHFLDNSSSNRPGTALVVAPLKSMLEMDRQEKVVLRAHSDWQRFQSDRRVGDRVWDWHTLEGPCVHKHEGRYYCFFSSGRSTAENYGVDYGVSDHVLGPYSDKGNEAGPRVLKTLANRVIGPGHNSIVTGPDGETEYIVYHAWDKDLKTRQMFLDRLNWTSEGPRCDGPTWGPNFNSR